MKKRSFALWVALAVLSLTVTFYACKKADKTPDDTRALEDAKALFRDRNTSSTQILNQKVPAYFSDAEGRQISTAGAGQQRLNSVCPLPFDDFPTATLYSVVYEYTCNVGYQVEVTYEFILIYEPKATNIAATQNSFGRIRLKNSGGTVVWPSGTVNYAIAPSNIVDLGAAGTDPNGNPYKKWRVSFKTGYIPETTWASSTTIEPFLFVYTDCPDIPSITMPYNPASATLSSANNSFPCTRIDKVFFNPASGGMPPVVSGCNAAGSGCFPFGYVYPHRQELQFEKPAGTWNSFQLSSHVSGSPSTALSLITYFDVYFINLTASGITTPGTYKVRYRNNHMGSSSNGGPCVTNPSGSYVYENWYLN